MPTGIFLLSLFQYKDSLVILCCDHVLQKFLVFNANSVDSDQTPRFAASDLGLYTVCQCPIYGTPGINGLTVTNILANKTGDKLDIFFCCCCFFKKTVFANKPSREVLWQFVYIYIVQIETSC